MSEARRAPAEGAHPQHASSHVMPELGNDGRIGTRFLLSLALTAVVLAGEVIGGILTGSLALLSDAAHVFLDLFALGLAYGATRLAARSASDRHTYGFHRMKVIAAFVNGGTLLVVAVEIFREAVSRFRHPEPVLAGPMLVVAAVGLAVNLLVAFVLRRHDHDDINARAAFLHVLGDALSSVGVIAAAVVLFLTGWSWVDPLMSVLIGIVILAGSGRVLRQAVHILNEGVPEGMHLPELSAALRGVPAVVDVHDLHVWTVGPGYPVLSAHVVLADRALSGADGVMCELKDLLSRRFGIDHTTIQFECADCGQGALACMEEVEQ